MSYHKGFDKEAFYDWLEQQEAITVYDVLDKVIEYAHRYEHISKDQFVHFISMMMPDYVSFDDVAQFAEDGILTDTTLKLIGRRN